ncbi:Conidiation protein 6-domain-containing protein [Mycena crocata]|nr:Conidiation protein 6-domain-containing protein [Mycena crocata]
MSSNSTNKDPVRVAAGLKATLHRDNVSAEAKKHAEERLEEMGAVDNTSRPESVPSNHTLGGYKSTLTNDATSDEAKAHAREILEAAGYTVSEAEENTDEHQVRVLAGYKAALNNPRVSEGAKKHAREYLQEHGAL